jgi:hypothetical protein
VSDDFQTQEGYTVSFKTDESYSAALIVVRGSDDRALEQNLDRLTEDLIQKVVDVRQLVLATNTAAAVLAGTAPASPPASLPDQGATQNQQSPPQGGSPDVKTCAHGVRQYKTGNGRTGPWAAWMCPLPRNAQGKCDPLWDDNV